MRSRFTYIGSTVIEVVVNGDSLTWNVLQDAAAAPVAPPREALPPVFPPASAAAPVAADLPPANTGKTGSEESSVALEEPSSVPTLSTAESSMTLAAAPTKKKRTLWGLIRAAWFVVFSVTGEVVTYLLDNLTALNLPPGTGVAVGAALYGIKRGVFPDTTL